MAQYPGVFNLQPITHKKAQLSVGFHNQDTGLLHQMHATKAQYISNELELDHQD
ncbi:hypothetical protein YYU_04185 [Anaplasma phagocytophilum str. HZ2]|nr:hypothetical protein YYU_04185 [Anaplasma phagocytophilum str. HZ2]AGR80807.1 hypothetical protein WSQ_04210 [Anaplasma phagocytophilum str. JM]AGR82059.1 hypothetical protein YYY_04200 [Anaplasma phagocytophilum str. Dog2]